MGEQVISQQPRNYACRARTPINQTGKVYPRPWNCLALHNPFLIAPGPICQSPQPQHTTVSLLSGASRGSNRHPTPSGLDSSFFVPAEVQRKIHVGRGLAVTCNKKLLTNTG